MFDSRRKQALGFYAVQGGVDGSGGDRAVLLGCRLHGSEDSPAIGLIVEAEDGEEDDLFEGAEEIRHAYNVDMLCAWMSILVLLVSKKIEVAP